MSGPKESNYDLAERIRRQEHEKRLQKIEEEKCRLLEVKIANKNEELKALEVESIKLKQHSIDLKEQLDRTSHPNFQVIEHFSHIITEIIDKKPVHVSPTSENLKRKLAEMNLDIQTMSNHLQTIRKRHGELVEFTNVVELHTREASLENFTERQRVKKYELNERIQEVPEKLLVFFEQFLSEVRGYHKLLPKKVEITHLINAIHNIYEDEETDIASKEEFIRTRKKTFDATKDAYDREIIKKEKEAEIFQEQFLKYQSLTSLLQIKRKPIHSFENSMDTLNEEIAYLNELFERKHHNQVVAETVNEVMSELGYNMLISDEIHTPKREVDHRIYEFHNNNVINTYTSDSGTILFEVMGVKEDDTAMTALEKLKVKEGMDDFCSVFPEITEKLIEKGINVSLKRAFPADVKFARSVNIKGIKDKKAATKQRKVNREPLRKKK